MKDEYLVRIEALKLTLQMGGMVQSGRLKAAHELEQYILNGYSGEAPPAPSAPREVPGTEGKDPPARPTTRGKRGSGKTGEASDQDKGESGPADEGRPSTRVAGAMV